MTVELCPVEGVRTAGEGIYLLSFSSEPISSSIQPGQFVNIRVEGGCDPLLRRPFSAYHVHEHTVEILFNVVGRGTAALARKRPGDRIDVLGPLGVPFSAGRPDFDSAILIAGGLGVAPLPLLTSALRRNRKSVMTFLGARSSAFLVRDHLETLREATEDGSAGFRGNVVDLARDLLATNVPPRPRIFACGPMPMLRAVAAMARSGGIPCEVSLEGPMGCGIGICQGCPVERSGEERSYALMCKDGPVFDIGSIRI